MIHAIRWALIIAGIPLCRCLFQEIMHPSPRVHRHVAHEFE